MFRLENRVYLRKICEKIFVGLFNKITDLFLLRDMLSRRRLLSVCRKLECLEHVGSSEMRVGFSLALEVQLVDGSARRLEARVLSLELLILFAQRLHLQSRRHLSQRIRSENFAIECDVMSQRVIFFQISQNFLYFFDESQSEKMLRKMRIEIRYASE